MYNKTVIVTGGSKGLGLAIISLLAQEGYSVVNISRSKGQGIESLEELYPGRIHYYSFDLCEISAIRELVQEITARHGRIFGLVNNAAVGIDGVLATQHESEIERAVSLNLLSAILLTKYTMRTMLLNRNGRIINISSIIASTGFNGLSVYAATKSALVGFTKSLAREVGKAQVTVNCVAPGYMKTEMTNSINEHQLETIRRRSPLGRLVGVDEVAKAVSFLLGDSAASITGTTITVDAGSTS